MVQCKEVTNLQKEQEKLKEAVSSADYRIKWFQNKLKDELENHKVKECIFSKHFVLFVRKCLLKLNQNTHIHTSLQLVVYTFLLKTHLFSMLNMVHNLSLWVYLNNSLILCNICHMLL